METLNEIVTEMLADNWLPEDVDVFARVLGYTPAEASEIAAAMRRVLCED